MDGASEYRRLCSADRLNGKFICRQTNRVKPGVGEEELTRWSDKKACGSLFSIGLNGLHVDYATC